MIFLDNHINMHPRTSVFVFTCACVFVCVHVHVEVSRYSSVILLWCHLCPVSVVASLHVQHSIDSHIANLIHIT